MDPPPAIGRTDAGLSRVVLGVYVGTAVVAGLGIVGEFAFPDRRVPYLWQLISGTLLATAGAVLVRYRRDTAMRHATAPPSHSHSPTEAIERALRLFKAVMASGAPEKAGVRLNFLAYDPTSDSFRMVVQDDDYPDADFQMGRREATKKGFVFAEAWERKGPWSRNLDSQAHEKYKETAVSETLKAVMASPVRNAAETPVGVLAIDMEVPFEGLGVPLAKLNAMFMKLCKLVEVELKDVEAGKF